MFHLSHRPVPVEEPSVPIRINPQLKTYRQTRLLLLVSIVVVLAAMIGFSIWMIYLNTRYPGVPFSNTDIFFIWIPALPFLLIMIMSLLSNIKEEHYWQRIETLRFAALVEDQPLLADEQPEPDAEALKLPASITTRVNMRSALAGVLIFPALLVCYALLSLLVFRQPWLSTLPYLIFSLLFVVVVMFLLSRARTTILVTTDGVRIPGTGGHTWISWHEIRLFACYRAQAALKKGAVLTYELSTPTTIIRWTWLQHSGTFWNAQMPILPFPEHTTQMQAFARYIVAKTGLPLYDLSKGQAGNLTFPQHAQAIVAHPQQRAQAETPSSMVCSNPLLGTLKMMRLLYLGIMAFVGVDILFMHATVYVSGLLAPAGFAGFLTSLWSVSAGFVCNALLWLILIVLISLVERFWKQIEHLRFTAAAGAEHLLSANQPQPHAAAVRLPMTITLRIARSFALFVALGFFLSILLFFLLIDVVNPVGRAFFLHWPVNGIGLALLVGLAWGAYLFYARRRTRIEVSESGIRVFQNKQIDARVSWEEARLFACYSAPFSHSIGDELVYELSSGSSVVRWSWVQRSPSLRLMWTATTSFGEHRAQMQALVELIAARTGLQLYDLRRAQ